MSRPLFKPGLVRIHTRGTNNPSVSRDRSQPIPEIRLTATGEYVTGNHQRHYLQSNTTDAPRMSTPAGNTYQTKKELCRGALGATSQSHVLRYAPGEINEGEELIELYAEGRENQRHQCMFARHVTVL